MDDHSEFITGKKIRSLFDVSSTTLHRWHTQNKIRVITTPMGHRRYCLQDIQAIISGNTPSIDKKKISYCRVSSYKQMDDLERQKAFFRFKFPDHDLVADIGSGINWKRKGLKTILEQSMQGKISQIVVAHRDRLCRFAFELLESIFKINGVELLVLDEETHQSSQSELADDILSIIHIYSCRAMGKRRYDSKKNKDLSDTRSKKAI
jgi:predicted site-specific integrase-resolvase